MEVRTDCRHFRGDRPCGPHKERGLTCTCDEFEPRGRRILIIKLGAAGDVARTTPVLRALRRREPAAEITWVTRWPALVGPLVDHCLPLDFATGLRVLTDRFDLAINLDKDREAGALLERVTAVEKRGFGFADGHCRPLDEAARRKYETGLDDGLNRRNRRSYPEEACAIAGVPFAGEEYALPAVAPDPELAALPGPRVGLNTGCGPRWPRRLWPDARWAALVSRVAAAGMTPILLGGPAERSRNEALAARTGALAPAPVELDRFAARIRALDVLVTPVTLAAHLAIGHAVPLVLLNNLFNRHEFELYGRGTIVEPDVPCLGCFTTTCTLPCMETLGEERVLRALRERLDASGPLPRPRTH